MNERSTQDSAALLLIMMVGLFVVGTMIALVVLAFAGQTGGQAVWAGLFSLTTAILGVVGGYLGATSIEQQKQKRKPPTD